MPAAPSWIHLSYAQDETLEQIPGTYKKKKLFHFSYVLKLNTLFIIVHAHVRARMHFLLTYFYITLNYH